MIHLHVHTNYSLLDGSCNIEKLAVRAKELEMSHLAMTDHGNLAAAIEFQQACIKNNITPILGCEMYHTEDMNHLALPLTERDKIAINKAKEAGIEIPKKITKKALNELIADYKYDTKQYHILLIAKNQIGWKNLIKIQSIASDKCTYNGRSICDDELLKKYSEGIICSTACIGNRAANLFIKDKDELAIKQLNTWKDIFGDDFYIEIQPLNINEQHKANIKLINYAKENNVKIIATNDVHYVKKEDHEIHDILLCIQSGKFQDEENRMKFSNDFWLRSEDEMIEAFEEQHNSMEISIEDYMDIVDEAIINTYSIAHKIESIKLGSNKPLFPDKIELPKNFNPEDLLTLKCFRSLYAYKKKKPNIDLKVYEQRLYDELEVINQKGYANYFLTVEEYVQWCENNDVLVGPGRGSVAGSLTAFLLGITKQIDPIEYDLLFSRFLTKDRTSPPDIDLDFEDQEKVITHLEDLYGKSNVAHIGTFTYYTAKTAIKDVAKVLRLEFKESNAISKEIDTLLNRPSIKFKHLDALEGNALIAFQKLEEKYKDIFRIAREIEGAPKNFGVHACGILITPMPIDDLIPVRTIKGQRVTLYTGTQLEDLNFIKFDLLSLETLKIIKNCLIATNISINELYDKVDVDDPNIHAMLTAKETDAIFQLESDLFKQVIKEIKPNSLKNIIDITSICRPGPLSIGLEKTYAKCKNGKQKAVEPLKDTWDIVKETQGCIIYQEQVMFIGQKVAGFNDNQSDSILRKAIAKKIRAKMDLCRQLFIYGSLNEVPPDDYDFENKEQVYYDPEYKLGEAIKGGINNGYEKEALITFWDSLEGYADYLFNKSHAATYSYITMLTAYFKYYYPVEFFCAVLKSEEKLDKIEHYIDVAKKFKIKVKPPNINNSDFYFSISKKQEITYGLNTIKGVGATSIPDIINNRPYTSLEDAFTRIPKSSFDKRVGRALIMSGSFDDFNSNRYELYNQFLDLRKDKEERLNPEDYNKNVCIKLETNLLGIPLKYKPWWKTIRTGEIVKETFNLIEVKERTDKNGGLMGFIKLEHENCIIDAIIFASQYVKNINAFDMTRVEKILVKGKKDEKGMLIIKSAQNAESELSSSIKKLLA